VSDDARYHPNAWETGNDHSIFSFDFCIQAHTWAFHVSLLSLLGFNTLHEMILAVVSC
jgi:hypothetical protein